MKNKISKVLVVLSLISFTSCSQDSNKMDEEVEKTIQKTETVKNEPHRYGGWYCPDNLNGFPAVNIKDWKNVSVVNGRMATKEETRNGSSLIFVDLEKYPNAKPLDLTMPRLASIYSNYTKREELIIVIQALNIDNDSIVGFRYLNGGNGSARLNEVKFLSDNEAEMIPVSQFVTQTINIKAKQDVIWKVLTNPENAASLKPIFDIGNTLKGDWRKNVNYHYANSGNLTSAYAEKLYGNFYIQNDYVGYNEKFILLENAETQRTELKIVCGPYGADFESQKAILNTWALKVKALSEID